MRQRSSLFDGVRMFCVILGPILFLTSCATEPLGYGQLTTSNLVDEPSGKYTGLMSVGSIKAKDEKHFSELSAAIETSLRLNGLLHAEGSEPAYVLDVDIVRHERVRDEYLVDEYEATMKYKVVEKATEQTTFEEEIESKFSSDQTLGSMAKHTKEMVAKEQGDLTNDIIMSVLFGPMYGAQRTRPGHDMIRRAEASAAAYVVQENLKQFILKISEE